jgi:hypothetical protein
MAAMSERHLDGNGVAGLLGEALGGGDPTTLRRICQGCGDEHVLGAHRAYRGAGVVLRCPGCGAIAVRIVERAEELTVEWRGAYRLPR